MDLNRLCLVAGVRHHGVTTCRVLLLIPRMLFVTFVDNLAPTSSWIANCVVIAMRSLGRVALVAVRTRKRRILVLIAKMRGECADETFQSPSPTRQIH